MSADPVPAFCRPRHLDEAIAALARGARALAGGTDLYPAATGADLPGSLVDLAALPGLRGISQDPDGALRIGACTTWAEIARAALPPSLAALQEAAREVGGRQIQAAGTLGGNLCNASPAADGVPPLMACDAEVEIAGPARVRRLPLPAFLTGPRRTALERGEVLTAVILPGGALGGRSRFLKLGARRHLVISIAMVAVRLEIVGGTVRRAALAVGACSPVARRLPAVEAALKGVPVAAAAGCIDPAAVAAALDPIDDPRASAAYRARAACALLHRAVAGLAGQPE